MFKFKAGVANRFSSDPIERLNGLADEFGVERNGLPGWGLILAYELAVKYKVPGFGARRKQHGRPLKKTADYRVKLAAALALVEQKSGPRGARARTARELAAQHILGVKQSRPSKKDGENRARQYQNDLSPLRPSERELGIYMVRQFSLGVTAEELKRKLALLETGDLEAAKEVIREIMEATQAHTHKN